MVEHDHRWDGLAEDRDTDDQHHLFGRRRATCVAASPMPSAPASTMVATTWFPSAMDSEWYGLEVVVHEGRRTRRDDHRAGTPADGDHEHGGEEQQGDVTVRDGSPRQLEQRRGSGRQHQPDRQPPGISAVPLGEARQFMDVRTTLDSTRRLAGADRSTRRMTAS